MSELKLQQCRLDGRYDVLECLGRGSYAEVYVARDLANAAGAPQTIVIKALNTSLQGVPDAELERTLIENFRNEALALDRVRHPHIISRLGHGTAIDLQNRPFHYLVLEYLPGGDLQALCHRHPLTLERALFYFEQIAAGLQHAHEHGVIHRDIKPQNLLLTADQKVLKIADFGVAKIEAAEGAITRVGTDVYAAPEHHPLMHTGPLDADKITRQTMHLTPAADVYSLAKTTYMLLTGEAPRRFSQRPITELPASIGSATWASFVLRTLTRATQTDPAQRHQSVREFRDELHDALMPGTQLLTRQRHDEDINITSEMLPVDEHGAAVDQANAKLPTTAPPPPSFASSSAGLTPSARPRIVIPVPLDTPLARSFHQTHEKHPVSPLAHDSLTPEPKILTPPAKLPSRARRWLVALLLILVFAMMLFATHNYVSNLRNRHNSSSSSAANDNISVVGREFIALTDINLRSGPNRSNPKVGVADRGARVRVLRVNGLWYEVEILERQRPKNEPDEVDQGWLNREYLRAR